MYLGKSKKKKCCVGMTQFLGELFLQVVVVMVYFDAHLTGSHFNVLLTSV